MQMEGVDHWGRNAVAEAMDAEDTLRLITQIEERHRAKEFTDEFLPRENAIHGIAMAIPLSLSLWAMIGLLLWALLR